MADAFTIKGTSIKNSLRSKVFIHYNGESIEETALWDTGATLSCISESVIEKLKLVETGFIPMHTPSGHDLAKTYSIDVTLPNNVHVPDLKVCSSKIGDQGIGMLIGMDIINRGDFVVNNHAGITVFSFRMPSGPMMDFVSTIRTQNIIQKKRAPKSKFNGKKKR